MKRIVWERMFLALLLIGNVLLVWRFFSYPFPFAFGAPFFPLLAGLVSRFGVDYEWAVRWLLLAFFVVSPITLYLFVREISKSAMSAAIAAAVFSLPLFRSRIEALVVSGDGAHIAALAFIPLVMFLVLRFLRQGSFMSGLLGCVGVLLVALSSPFGLFVTVSVLLVLTFSEMLLSEARMKFLRFLLILVVSAGLSAFWYNPAFVQLVLSSSSGKAVTAAVKNLIPISFFTVPILGTFGFLLFEKRVHLQPLFVALGLTIMFGLLSFAGSLARFAVSAQSRYLPELLLSTSFLWGVIGRSLYNVALIVPQSKWFPIPSQRREVLRKGLVVGFAVFCMVVALVFPYQEPAARRRAQNQEGSTLVVDIAEVRERTGGLQRGVGYGISGVTLVATLGLWGWVRRQQP